MEKSNTKKGIFNIVFGVLSELITIILGIIIPRLFLLSYGSEVNGLLNLVSQIYVYMGLLEAGVGAATLQSLYKPVANQDKDSINRILAATHRYYTKIGTVYLVFVLLLAFVYPLAAPTTIPYATVAAIIFLNGIVRALSFFFHEKFRLLLQAEGKKYIITNLNLIIHILTSLAKVALILAGCNIITIQAVFAVINAIQLVYISVYFKRHYKWIDLTVPPDTKALKQKNSAFVHQVSDLVFRNTDVLVLSYAPNCCLLVVSVYTTYNMLLNLIGTAINTLCSGIEFIMGQTFNTDRERYVKLHDIYETYSMTLVFGLYTVAYVFLTPFLKLYTSGITDITYTDKWLPLLFSLTFLLSGGRRASAQVINFAQHFKKTQGRAITEAVINITVSIVGVFFFGIYGVLLGTIAALLYRTNDMILYANHRILERSAFHTYLRWISNFVLFGIIAFVAPHIPWNLSNYFSLIMWAVIAGVGIIAAYFALAVLIEPTVFKNAKSIIFVKFKKRRA